MLLWVAKEKFWASECNQELRHIIQGKGMIKKSFPLQFSFFKIASKRAARHTCLASRQMNFSYTLSEVPPSTIFLNLHQKKYLYIDKEGFGTVLLYKYAQS